jgi:DNA uptake protein ComE-like DNA-binding protein
MKKTGTDLEQASAEIASKDKQTLVLFLLGLFILALPYLSLEREAPPPAYGIAQLNGTEHWQVISLAKAATERELRKEDVKQASEQGSGSIFFSEKIDSNNLPVELTLFFNRPLPINKSRQEDLEMLPGIGPHLASVIISELQKKGRLAGPDDLLNIPGIGPKTLQRLLPLISFKE